MILILLAKNMMSKQVWSIVHDSPGDEGLAAVPGGGRAAGDGHHHHDHLAASRPIL